MEENNKNITGMNILDISAFNKALEVKDSLVNSFNSINEKYDSSIKSLQENWKGYGAEAFFEDAKIVKKNITDIFDVLSAMCSIIEDCRDFFVKVDGELGEFNRNPNKE